MRADRQSRGGRFARSGGPGAGGGGGGGGFALKGVSQVSGTAVASSLALPGDPQEGDLAVMVLSGAGGIGSHYDPVTPAGWTSITTRNTSGRIIHKILGAGETTGPTSYVQTSGDGHCYMAVFSGAQLTTGSWCSRSENTGGVLTGSNKTTRVINLAAAATEGDFVFLSASGTSGTSAFAGTITTDFTDEAGALLYDGIKVTFGHGDAGSVWVSDGATTAFTFSGLDPNFNFDTNVAFYGGYAVISPA